MNNYDTTKQAVIKCFHCGNETLMNQEGEFKWGSANEKDQEFSYQFEYKMFACPICHKVTLSEAYSDESMMEPSRNGQIEWYSNTSILYPSNSIESHSIPPKVKEAFEAALKTKNIDNSICLMALRRTLELILKDKGATKWGLKDKIEEIAQKGLLPDTLKEASAVTKVFGDSAAHGKELEIGQHDVAIMVEFVEYIIQYLYILPEKINAYKLKISPEKDGS